MLRRKALIVSHCLAWLGRQPPPTRTRYLATCSCSYGNDFVANELDQLERLLMPARKKAGRKRTLTFKEMEKRRMRKAARAAKRTLPPIQAARGGATQQRRPQQR